MENFIFLCSVLVVFSLYEIYKSLLKFQIKNCVIRYPINNWSTPFYKNAFLKNLLNVKIYVLNNFAKLKGNTESPVSRASFLIKLHAKGRHLYLLKRRLKHRWFLVNFEKHKNFYFSKHLRTASSVFMNVVQGQQIHFTDLLFWISSLQVYLFFLLK